MCSVSLSKESVHICLSICTPTYAFSTILPFVPHPLIYPSIHPSIHLSAYVSRYCEVLARCKLQIEAKSMQSSGVFLSLSLSLSPGLFRCSAVAVHDRSCQGNLVKWFALKNSREIRSGAPALIQILAASSVSAQLLIRVHCASEKVQVQHKTKERCTESCKPNLLFMTRGS